MGKILILGGTQFIGRNIAEFLLENTNHDIVLFNRGVTAPELNANFNCIHGDRYSDQIQQIANYHWDFVIDVSCYFPEGVRLVREALKRNPALYVFISTCSVYDHQIDKSSFRNETYPILSCSEKQAVDKGVESYGARKAECERVVGQFDFPKVILRPALVVGPHDHTDRFYYWINEVYKQRHLVVPGEGRREFSVTYVMDLVRMILRLISDPQEGVYNAISFPSISIREVIRSVESCLDKRSEISYIPEEWLINHNVSPWTDIPLWLDTDMHTYNPGKFRSIFDFNPTPWVEAIGQTIDHYRDKGWPQGTYGWKEERKQAVLREFEKSLYK